MDTLKNFISCIEKNLNKVQKELDKMKKINVETEYYKDIA